MSFTKSVRTQSVSNHPGQAASIALRDRQNHSHVASVTHSGVQSAQASFRGSRPGTASTSKSIINMLMVAKRQGAAASHLVTRHGSNTRNFQTNPITTLSTVNAVRNIMARNPKLPQELVEKYANEEFSNALKNGRL